MQNAAGGGVRQARNDLANQPNGVSHGQGAAPMNQVGERAAADQLHCDDGYALDLGAAKDVDRVWMAERRGQAAFPEKPSAIRRVGQRDAQRLERDPPPRIQVFAVVDLAHPTGAKQPANAVGTELPAWREPARRPGGRMGMTASSTRRRMHRRRARRVGIAGQGIDHGDLESLLSVVPESQAGIIPRAIDRNAPAHLLR